VIPLWLRKEVLESFDEKDQTVVRITLDRVDRFASLRRMRRLDEKNKEFMRQQGTS